VAEVVVFGSIAVDHLILVDRFPDWDEVKIVKTFSIEPGGSAANVAYTLAKLGVKVSLISKVGGDYWARLSLNSLRKAGVNVSRVIVDEKLKTVHAYIVVVRGKKVVFVPLADDLALSPSSPSEIDFSLIDKCRLVYLGEVFLEVARVIAEYSRERGKTVVYRVTTPYAKKGFENLKNVLSRVDILLLNSKSWELLEASGARIDELLDMGIDYVVVTMGEKGVEVNGILLKPPPLEVRVLDTTGCGDAFAAGLIKKLLEGARVEEAVRFGMILAYYIASELGARKGVDKFVKNVYISTE